MLKMNFKMKPWFGMLLLATLILNACQQPGKNSTGSEYMPDMAHSIAYEANYYNYYVNNTWGSEEEYYSYAKPKDPVLHTVPRGSYEATAGSSATGISIDESNSVPYEYADTEDDRSKAMENITTSPFPITEKSLSVGKELYAINCAICHGDKGDGAGYLVRDDGGKYPVQPANFLLDEFVNASNGRFYHAIIYGKNLMGGYSDKLNFSERWDVIQYIRSLQAGAAKKLYSPMENTLNSDVPAAMVKMAMSDMHEMNEVETMEDHQKMGGEETSHNMEH